MKRTTLILFILFAILGSGTAWYLSQSEERGKRTYRTPDMNFAVDTNDVYKVFLVDRKGNETTLVRNGDQWIYNGKHKVRFNAIDQLLGAMSNVIVKYRPPKTAYKAITKELAGLGIKVEAYDKNDQLLKSYYVGGTDEDGGGTFMIMEGSNEPFATYMRNFIGSMRPKYFLVGDEWRDRTIFPVNLSEIQKITVDYPKQKNKSFRLEKKDGTFQVNPFYSTTSPINRPYREGSAEQFIEGFKKAKAEAFQNEYPYRDTLSTMLPFAVVSITTDDGQEVEAKFIPFHATDRYGNIVPPDYNKPIFRYHVDTNLGDFLVTQQLVVGQLFTAYENFFASQ